jgi:hypothetical protein
MPNSINRRNFLKTTAGTAGLSMMPDGLLETAKAVTPILESTANSKPKGISIHIGINRVNPVYYRGRRFGDLTAAHADAQEMYKIAQRARFQALPPILSENATKGRVRDEIESAAKKLIPGDILFISYSGHGMSVFDSSHDELTIVPGDTNDEAWVLYDGALLDDELYSLWGDFDNIRILVISDSCYSGTITALPLGAELINDGSFFKSKGVPMDIAKDIYEGDRRYYKGLQLKYGNAENKALSSQLLALSACQDGQTASDGSIQSLFTGCLMEVWQNGAFTGTYWDFYKQIVLAANRRISPLVQRPNFFPYGTPQFGYNESPFFIS